MIENSYIAVESDGKRVTVKFYEDGELREGPATFPARPSSFAAIGAYCDTQLGSGRKLSERESVEIQGLLGSPWPERQLIFKWKTD